MSFRVQILQKFLYAVLKVSGWKKNVLLENLDYVYPEMSIYQKKKFRNELLKNLSHDASEFLTRNWIYSKGDLRFSVDEKSVPVLENMKQGGLMLTAHFGNYEAIGPWLVRLGIPLLASYAKLKPKFLDRWVYSRYRSIDNYNYSLFINNPREILNILDEKKLFCLVADQDFRHSHFIRGNLFGKPVHCNPIPVFILKYRPKTPVYICWLKQEEKKKTLFAKEIKLSNIEEIYLQFHQWLERIIFLSPERWYGWIHRRYLSSKTFK